MPRALIVGIGEILWDMLPAGKQLGGAPANFGYHARALGADGVVVSRVGADEPGREILGRLRALGLDVSHVSTDPSHPTGRVDVRLDARGVPDYVIHEGVAWDFIPADAPLLDLALRADAACFGTLAQRAEPSRSSVRRFLRSTRPDCLRVLDINLRQSYFDAETMRELMKLATVLKLNDAELPVVGRLLGFDPAPGPAIDRLLADYPLRLIALTRGDHGSVLYTREGAFDHPGFASSVADTVGAGDAFTAALVLGMLNHDSPGRINEFANRVAAYVCSQPGATPDLPPELAHHFSNG